MTKEEMLKFANEELIEKSGFISINNFKVVDIDELYCKLEAKVTENSLNPYGMCHGGFIFGLMDTAAGVASRTSGKNSLTIDSTINYLKPGTGEKLVTIAECVKSGKTIAIFDVKCFNDHDEMIAKATVSYIYI